MGLAYKPDFSLTADNKDITDAIKRSLVELTLTDNNGDKSDRLALTLMLPDGVKTPTKGAVLSLSLGFSGALVNKGKFTVNQISISGPPRLIQVIANATKLDDKSGSTPSMQSKATRSYDDLPFGDLLKEVALRHGLEAKVGQGLGVYRLDHVDQVNESDMNLLMRLAKQTGNIVKYQNESLILLRENASESVTGKPLPNVKITPDMVSTWQYQSASDDDAKKVTAEYEDVETGERRQVSIGTGEPEFTMAYSFSSKAEAEAAIKARIEGAESGASTIDLTLPATPDLLPLISEGTITLMGFGDVEDNQWIVKNLEWSLSSNGLQLRISANIGVAEKKKPKPLEGTED